MQSNDGKACIASRMAARNAYTTLFVFWVTSIFIRAIIRAQTHVVIPMTNKKKAVAPSIINSETREKTPPKGQARDKKKNDNIVLYQGKKMTKEEVKAIAAKLPPEERGISRGNPQEHILLHKRRAGSGRVLGSKNKLTAEEKPKAKPRGVSRLGKQNLVTRNLKEMILAALDNKGGVKYLEIQAVLNPPAFMALLGKILPTQVVGDKDNPLQLQLVATANELASKMRGTLIDGVAQRVEDAEQVAWPQGTPAKLE